MALGACLTCDLAGMFVEGQMGPSKGGFVIPGLSTLSKVQFCKYIFFGNWYQV